MIDQLISISGILNNEIVPLRSDNLLITIGGQSNSVGWMTGAPSETYLQGVIDRCYIFNGTSFDALSYATCQGNSGHGIELMVGYMLSKATTGKIYFVKGGVGNTALGDVAGTTYDWSITGTLFGLFAEKVNAATSVLTTYRIPFTYLSNWWYQGENDSVVDYLAVAYITNLDNLETRMRTSINYFVGSTKFLVARLSITNIATYLATIRSAQETKAYVDIDDLTKQLDNIHDTSEGQNEIARRFIAKILP